MSAFGNQTQIPMRGFGREDSNISVAEEPVSLLRRHAHLFLQARAARKLKKTEKLLLLSGLKIRLNCASFTSPFLCKLLLFFGRTPITGPGPQMLAGNPSWRRFKLVRQSLLLLRS